MSEPFKPGDYPRLAEQLASHRKRISRLWDRHKRKGCEQCMWNFFQQQLDFTSDNTPMVIEDLCEDHLSEVMAHKHYKEYV